MPKISVSTIVQALAAAYLYIMSRALYMNYLQANAYKGYAALFQYDYGN